MQRFSFLFLISFLLVQVVAAYDLVNAVADKKLTAVFTSTGEHRGKCVQLVVESKVGSTLILKVNPGTYLMNTDSSAQDFMITDFQMLVIPPGNKQELLLNALCCTRYKNCPKKDGLFEIGTAKSEASVALCKLIQQTQQYEYAGQNALWSLIERNDPNTIDGEDSAGVMLLRNFVGKEVGIKVLPFTKETYSKPVLVVAENLSIKTSGNHYVRQVNANDTVVYGVYNTEGMAVSEVKTDIVVANQFNKHNVVWNFAIENLNPAEKYYLKIKVNGVTQKEWAYYFWS